MCVRLFHLTVCVCRSRFATFVGVYVQFLHSTRAVRWPWWQLLVAQVVPEVEVIHLTHGANLRWWTTFLLLRPSRRKRKMMTWQTSAVVNARSAARWSTWGKADAPIRLVYLGIIISNSFKFFQNCFQETFQGFSLVFFGKFVCFQEFSFVYIHLAGTFLCHPSRLALLAEGGQGWQVLGGRWQLLWEDAADPKKVQGSQESGTRPKVWLQQYSKSRRIRPCCWCKWPSVQQGSCGSTSWACSSSCWAWSSTCSTSCWNTWSHRCGLCATSGWEQRSQRRFAAGQARSARECDEYALYATICSPTSV